MRNSQIDLIKQISESWKKAAEEIHHRFGFEPTDTTPEFSIQRFDAEKQSISPVHLQNGKAFISQSIKNLDAVLPLLVAKACLHSVLPQEALCEEIINDLSFEFARQMSASKDLREIWTNLWIDYVPAQEISPVIGYDPAKAYDWLYSIAGKKGIETIISELTYRAKNQIPMSFEEYLRYFSNRMKRFDNVLDATEMKIVNLLANNGNISFTNLSKTVDLSTEWVSRKISELKTRKTLREFTRVPFSKVNIDIYHITLQRMFGNTDSFPLLGDCPFLYSYRRALSGPWESIGTLCVPYNTRSLGYLEEGLRLLSKQGFNVNLHRIYSSGKSISFDFYREGEGWEIPWELMSVQLDRILKDDLSGLFPKIDKPQKPTTLELDDFDMEIIECIQQNITSISKIRSKLNVGQQRLANRLKILRQHQVIRTSWEVHNIGLNEHVFVFQKDPRIANAIAGWAQRLPHSIISFSENRELSLQVDLPSGGGYGFSSALEDVSTETQSTMLSPKIYGQWGFPGDLWDSKYQKWKCPEQSLSNWIETLKRSE